MRRQDPHGLASRCLAAVGAPAYSPEAADQEPASTPGTSLPRFVERTRLEREQAKVLAEAILETGQRLPSADDQLYSLRDERQGGSNSRFGGCG